MAGRTLRRPYSRAGKSADGTGDDSGRANVGAQSSSGSEPSSDLGADRVDSHVEQPTDDAVGERVIEIDPAQLGQFIAGGGVRSDSDGTGSASGRTRRSRSDAGKPRGKRQAQDQNIVAVVEMIHTMAATMLHSPELLVTEEEAKQLESAYNNFCAYHDVPVMNPKRMSEIVLLATVLKVEGSHVLAAVRSRKSATQPRRETARPTPGPVAVEFDNTRMM